MNKNIQYIIEAGVNKFIGSDIVNAHDSVQQDTVQEFTYRFSPRTKEQLVSACVELAEQDNYDWNCIDTSQITEMSWLLNDIIDEVNIPKGQFIKMDKWDVSNVENFHAMFKEVDFRVDLSKWSVSSCIWFDEMFCEYGGEMGDISKWNVSSGKVFSMMFYACYGFNCDLSRWNVRNGIFFQSMFEGCEKFNCDLSKWNVRNGEDFNSMFYECKVFFADLSSWKMKVNNQYNIHKMFYGTSMDSNNDNRKPQHVQMRRYAFNYWPKTTYSRLYDGDVYYYVENNQKVDNFLYDIWNIEIKETK